MENIKSSNRLAFANDPEVHAYLHQKLTVLQAYLHSDKPISVVVEEHAAGPSTKAKLEVQLWAETEFGELMVVSSDESPFLAINKATHELQRQIDALQNAMLDPRSRSQEVNAYSSGRVLVH